MDVVDAEGAKRIVDEGEAVVIDVLSAENFQEHHLPGAINIPEGDAAFERRVQQAVPDKDTPIMVYCADAECPASSNAFRKIRRLGYRNVVEFEDGLDGWRRAGHAFEGEGRRQVRADL